MNVLRNSTGGTGCIVSPHAAGREQGISVKDTKMNPRNMRVTILIVVTSLMAADPIWAMPQEGVPKSRKFAFLIGVNDYDDENLRDLAFAEKDIDALGQELSKQGFRVEILTTAFGKKDGTLYPRAKIIRDRLALVLSELTNNDIFLFAFAGQGMQLQGGDTAYLCVADSKFRLSDSGAINIESLIPVNELFTTVGKSHSGPKLFLIDACRNNPIAHRGPNVEDNLAVPKNFAVLYSCSRGQVAFETSKLGGGHGVFFYHVTGALRGTAKRPNGDVTWDGLVQYVRHEVPESVSELLGEHGGEQDPNIVQNLSGRPEVLAHIHTAATP